MRAAMLPFDNLDTFTVISEDRIGTNAGNMFFQYSLSRILTVDDNTSIDAISTTKSRTKEEVNRINKEYDCFVLPLANAFRVSFQEELRKITKLIKQLKIPCVVVGVGLQAGVSVKQEDMSFSFDQDVKDFMRAVLDKSDIVGVRGELTAAYLKNLGFAEGRQYQMIGCPSLFAFGDKLPETRRKPLTKDSMVCYNSSILLPQKFHDFLNKCRTQFPNHYFIPQNTADYRMLYAGVPIPLSRKGKVPENYPQHAYDSLFLEDRARAFLNVPTWLNFTGQAVMNYGSRIHGNIAGVLAGTPSFIFANDARVLELAQYHKVPYMLAKDITEKTDLTDIYEKTDFETVHEGHEKRFESYLEFLQKNGLRTIYDETRNPEWIPFDERMKQITLEPPIHSFLTQSAEERVKRMERFYEFLSEREPRPAKVSTEGRNKTYKRAIKKVFRI